eukprot:1177344-Prorocentrum_minimum.AAC.3
MCRNTRNLRVDRKAGFPQYWKDVSSGQKISAGTYLPIDKLNVLARRINAVCCDRKARPGELVRASRARRGCPEAACGLWPARTKRTRRLTSEPYS